MIEEQLAPNIAMNQSHKVPVKNRVASDNKGVSLKSEQIQLQRKINRRRREYQNLKVRSENDDELKLRRGSSGGRV